MPVPRGPLCPPRDPWLCVTADRQQIHSSASGCAQHQPTASLPITGLPHGPPDWQPEGSRWRRARSTSAPSDAGSKCPSLDTRPGLHDDPPGGPVRPDPASSSFPRTPTPSPSLGSLHLVNPHALSACPRLLSRPRGDMGHTRAHVPSAPPGLCPSPGTFVSGDKCPNA